MDWDYPGTNVPSTVLGAAEGLGTNRIDEIELFGAPIDKVKRRFKRQNTILAGQYPNVNLIMGSTCEAGCRAIVRIQLDQLHADGTLAKLKRPLYVFTGLQFEEKITEVDGDVLVVGDCAKGMVDKFPGAKYWGSCSEYPNCTPIWANRPDVGISQYVRHLQHVRENSTVS
jgi:hypothetical protein